MSELYNPVIDAIRKEARDLQGNGTPVSDAISDSLNRIANNLEHERDQRIATEGVTA